MKTRFSSHPLLSMTQEIDRQGLMVFDINSMPTYGKPFVTPYMVLVLNLEGWVKAECDMRPVCFRLHDIAVLPPRHILCAQETSADYHAMMITMSVDFQEDRKQDSTDVYRDNFHYLSRPHISLSDEQFAVVHQLFNLVQTISQTAGPTRDEKITNLLNTLFLLLQDYRRENGIGEHEPSPHELMFTQFYQAITEHYAEHREVRFYADLFHLSPKYFATIIKQHTKTNALDWINGYVMVLAKIMLRYKQQLTIQEIALKLGFIDQATFSRFFKSHSGMSPTAYRDQV